MNLIKSNNNPFMSKTSFKVLEEIFTNQITVLNIAVPIIPLDLKSAKELCLKNNYDVHLVRDAKTEDLEVYVRKTDTIRTLYDSEIISESTPLLEVIDILCKKEQIFVKVKRNITLVVTRSDLDTIPVRIWLYGMISLFEIELKERIIQTGIDWMKKLTLDRNQKAEELYLLKKSKNEEIDLLGCTQLGDLGTIILKCWEQFSDLFPTSHSKSTIQSSFNKINLLRDALAHGQKLQIEWPEIYNLIQLISYSLGKI
jgi:hypothetical protein